MEKFEKRIENGYDVFIDDQFVSWLRLYHPSYLPSDLADIVDLTSPNTNQSDDSVTGVPLAPTVPTSKASQPPSTPVSGTLPSARKVLSDVSEFLIYPSASCKKKSKPPGSARVLTSEQSLAILKEKEQKKRDEEAAKEQRKIDREVKRVQRETEQKKKAEQRELKAAEKMRRAAELEVEKKRKAEERERKAEERRKKAMEIEGKRKLRKNKCTQSVNKVFVTRSKSGYALQHSESSTNECMMCFGSYSDDLSAEGTPMKEWVQCTSEACSKWMHEECATKNEDGNIVCVCGAVFV